MHFGYTNFVISFLCILHYMCGSGQCRARWSLHGNDRYVNYVVLGCASGSGRCRALWSLHDTYRCGKMNITDGRTACIVDHSELRHGRHCVCVCCGGCRGKPMHACNANRSRPYMRPSQQTPKEGVLMPAMQIVVDSAWQSLMW